MRWARTEAGRERVDRWALTVPYFGKLTQKLAVARFARTLSTLLKSGVQRAQRRPTIANAEG